MVRILYTQPFLFLGASSLNGTVPSLIPTWAARKKLHHYSLISHVFYSLIVAAWSTCVCYERCFCWWSTLKHLYLCFFSLSSRGPARKLPSSVIELIKTVNRTLKLGQLLCRCRSPDFLLSIIKRQGTLESMKWLTDLVESSHSSMEVLPVPCLCEFLLGSYQDQLSGSLGSSAEGDIDPSSHRSHYKRKRSNKDKVNRDTMYTYARYQVH